MTDDITHLYSLFTIYLYHNIIVNEHKIKISKINPVHVKYIYTITQTVVYEHVYVK